MNVTRLGENRLEKTGPKEKLDIYVRGMWCSTNTPNASIRVISNIHASIDNTLSCPRSERLVDFALQAISRGGLRSRGSDMNS